MNPASWIILGIILLLAVLAVRKSFKDAKQGKCAGCSGCSATSGQGHCTCPSAQTQTDSTENHSIKK